MGPMAAGDTPSTGTPTTVESAGLGPFTTRRLLQRADGTVAAWESRRARKHARPGDESTWWAPGALGWWMAVLFAIGSACFALAAVPAFATSVGTRTDNLVYFVGSIFFTTAGFLQYGQVAATGEPGAPPPPGPVRRLLRFQPHRIDWVAAAVQSLGTLFFNVSTAHAYFQTFSTASGANQAIWRPDVFGSICFLVSSYLSFAEVCHGAGRWRPSDLSWWITILNLVGSVAFGVSAVASKMLPSGDLRSPTWTTLGTFVGGLCFLAASVLLLPERTAGALVEPSADEVVAGPGGVQAGA
jgi:hypothetical protein